MARPRKNALPKYLELNRHNGTYYYRSPVMRAKANLGKDQPSAIQLANSLNAKYRIQVEQQACRLEASLDSGVSFSSAFEQFIEKYIDDYQLKSSTARLLHQRRNRLSRRLGALKVPAIDTQILREAISQFSHFEQSKVKTLLLRFFRYAKSTGIYPSHLLSPVDDLFVDPVPRKRRQRMTLEQFRAIYTAAPQWLRWLMTLALHLALRRVDLVNLRFDDVFGDRIISPIRKTDTRARDIEATSVDFPIHPDVRQVLGQARLSSMQLGRCPFVIHRAVERRTKRSVEALGDGRLEHPAQVLPDYASKAFGRARQVAIETTGLFEGLNRRELPTLHEIRALSSHLYARAGYDVGAVQELMAHTDPDMTRAYQEGHARKVLRVEMTLPFSVTDDCVREDHPCYQVSSPCQYEEIFPENFLTKLGRAA